ncbi:MAG TPA: FecR domain-containing protein [Steroidobacteraceae bacterium]|nr:FecR domain-containing protein [Steroidobacteraceae bacterium]
MDPERYTAREEAAQWVAKLDRGLRQGEGLKLRQWLQQSAHRAAIVEVARQRAAPDVMALLTELFPISLQSVAQEPPRGVTGILVAVGAAACVLILGIWTFNSQRFSQFAPAGSAFHDSHGTVHPPMTKGAFATDVGQQREIKLPDGSTMMLNTASNVTVTYSLREREIFLSRGEASFNVAHDADRPFLVRAGHHHRLQAVGTRFDVRVLTPDTVELIVTEGQVTVLYTPREGPDTPAFLKLSGNIASDDTTIDALEMAQVEPGLQFVRKVKATDIEDALAWQRGRIVFKGERLEDALAEVDRYTNIRFVLVDDRLRDLRVAGDFSTGHIDDFVDSLRQNYQIAAERAPGGRIVLRPQPGST